MEGSILKTIALELKNNLMGTLEKMLPNPHILKHNHHHRPNQVQNTPD